MDRCRIAHVEVLVECPWKLDEAVFFNSRKDRAYLLLLIQDNLQKAELDYVYVIYAALEENKWQIYFAGLPNLVFPRASPAMKPIEMDRLSVLAKAELAKNYLSGDGAIKDQFVDRAYTADLKKKHDKFLRKKN